MKNPVLLIGVLVVLAVAVSLFLLTQQKPSPSNLVQDQTQMPSPSSSAQVPGSSADVDTLRAGGSSYTDPQNLYTFLYPNDFTLDTQDPAHIRIYKRGETQRPQSEMSDGVLVVFEVIDLEGKSLEEVLDARIQQSTADGTSEIIQSKQPTLVNTYPGYTYELRGLGTAKYIVLQKTSESKSAIGITFSVSDPKQQGYEEDVNAMLSTVELHK